MRVHVFCIYFYTNGKTAKLFFLFSHQLTLLWQKTRHFVLTILTFLVWWICQGYILNNLVKLSPQLAIWQTFTAEFILKFVDLLEALHLPSVSLLIWPQNWHFYLKKVNVILRKIYFQIYLLFWVTGLSRDTFILTPLTLLQQQ